MHVVEAARAHRALSDEVRLRLFRLIAEAEGPVDVAQMADALALHVNTIRSHLRRLEEAGLVTSEAEVRSERGRPRRLFRPGPAAEAIGSGARDYELLATMLAGYARAGAAEPAESAEETGREWGRYLVGSDRPHPGQTMDATSAIELTRRMMEQIGFEPEVERSDGSAKVLLHNCPFRSVAERYPDIVCSLHLGILRGALSETSAPVEASELVPWVTPSLCIATLEER